MNILEIKNLEYIVQHKTIFKNFNLKVEKNNFITIIGPSGAGKSTLLKLIASLISPTSGTILYRNKSINNYSPLAYRRVVSYCFQQPTLFGRTVRDNLLFPYQIRKKKVDDNHIVDLLAQVNLQKSFLDKDINSLSGGEKQRIALIRNLVFLPDVLLLDEVTTGLDSESKNIVHTLFDFVHQKGITILQVTHDQSEIEQAEKIVEIKGQNN